MTKRNYQTEMEEYIAGLTRRPKLLLHACCGPCSSYVTEYLAKYFDLTVFYYNPNIYPPEEFEKRLETQRRLLEETGLAELIPGVYDHGRYLETVAGHEKDPEGGERCALCFLLRLEETAKAAKDGGWDLFGTTLTVSPHKNAGVINRVGTEISERYGIPFLISDFKKKNGYKRSAETSAEHGLYRQNYCGCEFSIWDGAVLPETGKAGKEEKDL